MEEDELSKSKDIQGDTCEITSQPLLGMCYCTQEKKGLLSSLT